ncbi:MAG: AraC family transcriptional regulator [Porphyromonas sp.]|nr:AraC family transcriptional regulator [Porphyromonas sp.]
MMLFFMDSKSTIIKTDKNDTTTDELKSPFMMFLENGRKVTFEVGRKSRISTLTFDRLAQLCPSFSIYQLKTYAPETMGTATLDILEPIKDLVACMVRYTEDGLCCAELVESKLAEVLFVISAYYEPSEIGALFAPLLRREVDFKEFVQLNFLHVDRVKELADLRGVTLRAFNDEFKATFGTSPYSWMQERKAEMIEERLKDDVPFKEIIQEFRFSSPSHFTVFSKKHYGTTPSQHKHELQEREG